MPILTLTTDFGLGSPYVAQMKGVLLSLCREAPTVVDVSHAVPPQDVFGGALVLSDVCKRFPPGTLHVAVIDPGVGTSRRIVYVEMGEQRFIGPDNGLLSLVAKDEPPKLIVVLEHPAFWLQEITHTFHGRDIMAPAAAHLLNGVDPRELGPQVDRLAVELPWPEIEHLSETSLRGEVIYVDSFGNLITNIRLAELHDEDLPARIKIASQSISKLSTTYGEAAPGSFIALLDSGGRLEIAVVNGNAARALSTGRGEQVEVHYE